MKETGSITAFLTVILASLLVVALIVAEYAHIRYQFRKAQADQYLELDQAMSAFHRPLFQEMGLLAVESEEVGMYRNPLGERVVMEASILALMDQRTLVDLVGQAENLANDFLKGLLNVQLDVFDIQELNHELHMILELNVEAEDIMQTVARFVTKLITMQPYVELRGLGFQRLIDLLWALKFDEIKQISPYFVVRSSIRENYTKVLDTIRRYDVLNALDRYEWADYAVDYLGYSLTQTDKETLHTEYILTGARTKDWQRPVISAELFALRLTFNLIEILINPALRQRVTAVSLGIPKLFALEAVRLAAFEAYFDVNHLLERKPVPIYKGSAGFLSHRGGYPAYKSGWNYPDYLKVMLMLTPSRVYFNRLQTALEHNYEMDLDRSYTAIVDERQVTITSKVMKRDFVRVLKGELDYVRQGID